MWTGSLARDRMNLDWTEPYRLAERSDTGQEHNHPRGPREFTDETVKG
jgi:hypothetical protein